LLVTAKAGAAVDGGVLRVPAALARKKIHPCSGFLLHDVGTGPGVLREGAPAEAAGRVRTAALWGLGTRLLHSQPLVHDGSAKTIPEAIQRHQGSAAEAATKFQQLSARDEARLSQLSRQPLSANPVL
jgi:CxxC motif-containing protein (DUF1111 family)